MHPETAEEPGAIPGQSRCCVGPSESFPRQNRAPEVCGNVSQGANRLLKAEKPASFLRMEGCKTRSGARRPLSPYAQSSRCKRARAFGPKADSDANLNSPISRPERERISLQAPDSRARFSNPYLTLYYPLWRPFGRHNPFSRHIR